MKKILLILVLGSALFSEEIYATFTSQGQKEAKLKLNSSGIVDSIKVDIGSKVKKGQILLAIDNAIQVQNVEMQRAQAESAKATYEFQKNQFERYEQSKNVIDQNTFEQIQSTFKAADNAYKVANASLKMQQAMLENTYLKAPFDGVIATKSIELGEGVTQNATELFSLVSTQIKLILEFDSKYFGKIKVGDVFRFSIDGKQEKQETKITKVYPSIDLMTRKVKAEALVSGIPSGIFGDGYISTK